MKQFAAFISLLVVSSSCAQARLHELQFDQAREIALAVAQYDNITVDDRTIVMNSMDTRAQSGFIPGSYSFSIIRESDSPARPDETIRMYAISKRTGDTWEMNLCKHYSFPALQKLQSAITRKTGSSGGEDPELSKAIGCASQTQVNLHTE